MIFYYVKHEKIYFFNGVNILIVNGLRGYCLLDILSILFFE
jgi:hypothetical protein